MQEFDTANPADIRWKKARADNPGIQVRQLASVANAGQDHAL